MRQAVVLLVERRDADLDAIAELARDRVGQQAVDAIGIQSADGVVLALVDVFVPDGDAEWMRHCHLSTVSGRKECLPHVSVPYAQFRRVCRGRCLGGWW